MEIYVRLQQILQGDVFIIIIILDIPTLFKILLQARYLFILITNDMPTKHWGTTTKTLHNHRSHINEPLCRLTLPTCYDRQLNTYDRELIWHILDRRWCDH